MRATSLRIDKSVCPGYCLRRLRGRGGCGSVWEAEQADGRPIALKFLPCRDTLVAAQEVRSIQMVRRLRHPNLIRIDQVWAHRGYVVVTMELAEASLLELHEIHCEEYHASLGPRELCFFLSQAAEALDFLNRRNHLFDGQRAGIQHADIKPSNLLLFGDQVKLCDFGLSSATHSPLKSHLRSGTLDYAAPEVFQGRLSDWTDQYALAVTYFQLRTGRFPFSDTPPRFQPGYVRPAPDLKPLPAEEQAVIAKALAPVPRDRWSSCREMLDQLGRAARA